MCECINVEFGSYDNQLELMPPPHMMAYKRTEGTAETVCVDACLAEEVQHLWSLGITTTGCCCGHNKGPDYPYIGVVFADIPRMKDLGYQVRINQSRPGDEDSFIPKTIK